MPDYTLVLKTFANYRKMAPDDVALFETFCAMTDHQRELLAETLGPPVKAKVGKTAKTTRTFEKCEVCNYSRRAAVHKDSSLSDYHEFVSAQGRGSEATEQKKSKRGMELAAQLNKSTGLQQRTVATDDDTDNVNVALTGVEARGEVGSVTASRDYDTPDRCSYARDDGKPCKLLVDHNVHQMKSAMGYHEFQPSAVSAASGD